MFPVHQPNSRQFNNTTLLPCNTKNDCLSPEVSQCHKMQSGSNSVKSGYCVPYQCQSNKDCLTIGDICTSGSLSGTCNKENDKGICQYLPALAIATCGKKRSEKTHKALWKICKLGP